VVSDVWRHIRELYEAEVAHQFLLHLNVRDIVAHPVFGYIPFTDYLLWNISQLGEDTDWLVFSYDRSAGASFPEDLRVRGGARAAYQWRFGLNATLYKFAQSAAVAGNDRAALAALATLVSLHGDFADAIRDDTAAERPFGRLKGNPAFDQILQRSPIVRWRSLNAGIRAAATGIGPETPLNEVLGRLEGLLRGNPYNRRVAAVIERVEMLAPNRHRSRRHERIGDTESVLVTETLARWAWDKRIQMCRNLVVLLTENLADVAPEIVESRELVTLEVPMPSIAERRAFLRHLASLPPHWQPPPEPGPNEEPVRDWPPPRERGQYPDALRYSEGFSQRDAAQQTAGLTLSSLYATFLPVGVRSGIVERQRLQAARAKEAAAFSRGLLEVVPGDMPIEHVGGLGHVGRYFQEVAPRLLEGDRKSVPNGAWLLGPPGTGKTLTLRALSRSTILPVLRLRMPHELGARAVEPGLAQEDEYANNLLLALSYARSIGPTVLFVDRLDEVFRADRGPSQSSVTSRSLGLLVDWMARPDTRGDIFWVGAASRPHHIEPRLRAIPLMDTLVYLLPTPAERADILRKTLLHGGIPFDGSIPFDELARQPSAEHLTGEDLATISTRALRRARAANRAEIARDDLLAVLNDFSSESTPIVQQWLSLQAIRVASARSQLPDVVLPPLAPIALENNRIAKERIETRLRELATMVPPGA
jgi:hypothetical protein